MLGMLYAEEVKVFGMLHEGAKSQQICGLYLYVLGRKHAHLILF